MIQAKQPTWDSETETNLERKNASTDDRLSCSWWKSDEWILRVLSMQQCPEVSNDNKDG